MIRHVKVLRTYPEAVLAAMVLVAGLVVVALAFVEVVDAGIAAVIAIAVGILAGLLPIGGRRRRRTR